MITKNRQMGREAIEEYLNPLNGYRGMLAYKGKEVKDHIKANRAHLKKQVEENHSK